MEWPLSFVLSDRQTVLQWIDRQLNVDDFKIAYQCAYEAFQEAAEQHTACKRGVSRTAHSLKVLKERQKSIVQNNRRFDEYLVESSEGTH